MSIKEKYAKIKNDTHTLLTDTKAVEVISSNYITDVDRALSDLANDKLVAIVFGEFNAGKSTFLNALLGERVLPENVTRYTAIVTRVNFGTKSQARITWTSRTQLNDRVISVLEHLINRMETTSGLEKDIQGLKVLLGEIENRASAVYPEILKILKSIGSKNAYKAVRQQTTEGTLDFLDQWDILESILENFESQEENILGKNKVEENIPLSRLDEYVAYKEGSNSKCMFISEAEIEYQSDFLKSGVSFIDLPGTGISYDDTQKALGYGKKAHVVMALTPASTPLSKSDKVYLLQLKKNRDEYLDQLLMFVNRIDTTKQAWQPKAETYLARENIVASSRENLAKAGLTNVEVVAISALSAIKAKLAIKSGARGRSYDNLVEDFIVVDDDDTAYRLPEPDEFLESSVPYPNGKSWVDVEELLFARLVKNRGKILLGEILKSHDIILFKANNFIHALQEGMNLKIEEILARRESLDQTINKVGIARNEFVAWAKEKAPDNMDFDVSRVCTSVESKVSKKIKNSSRSGEALFRYIHDNMKLWIGGAVSNQLESLPQTEKDISLLIGEAHRVLNEHIDVITELKNSSFSADLEDLTSIIRSPKKYKPRVIPGRDEVTKTVWDPVWYNPFTYFRNKRIVVQKGRKASKKFSNDGIRTHYREVLTQNIESLRPEIENYCRKFYESSRQQLLSDIFGKIEGLLSEKGNVLDALENDLHRSEHDRERREKDLTSQSARIDELLVRNQSIDRLLKEGIVK
jgi:hypothetical protein